MKLCIEQKVFTFADHFNIFDEFGNVKYTCEGEFFSFGKKLHVYDTSGDEVAYIEQRLLSFLPTYTIYVRGMEVGEVKKEFSFFTPKYYVYGLDWNVEGEFLSHDYFVTRNGEPIVEIHKEWFTFGDCYSMDINDDYDEVLALSVCLAIDASIESSNHANNN